MKKKQDWANRIAGNIWKKGAVGADWHRRIAIALRAALRRGYKQGLRDHVCSITDVQP